MAKIRALDRHPTTTAARLPRSNDTPFFLVAGLAGATVLAVAGLLVYVTGGLGLLIAFAAVACVALAAWLGELIARSVGPRG